MEDSARYGQYDFNLTLASRKAEEAAWRRYEATRWLEGLVGPLGISNQPSEREFISCLRNGLVLCNAINKIYPGAVPKVVDNPSPLQSLTRESQPLPAYQYFENVRNFLVAVEELKLPAFQASDLERDTLDAGSAAKVVDCVLDLKSYHESKQMSSGNGFYKHVKSPMAVHSTSKMCSRPSSTNSLDSYRRLDMSAANEKQKAFEGENGKVEELFVNSLVDSLIEKKENIDGNLLASLRRGDMDHVILLRRIMSNLLEEQLQEKIPELQSVLQSSRKERSRLPGSPSSMIGDSPSLDDSKRCRACLRKDNCSHRRIFKMQEKELLDLKSLLIGTKIQFEDLQSQLQKDLHYMACQVQDLSTAALGYHRVVRENRTLYNMVQDLKGNIRVYCRIRPSLSAEAKNVIDFIGEDGSLVISDPSNPKRDGKKVFEFNRVFGPTSTQDEVFEDTRPLIRSVMDGYNVCIFAYGQTGSGKTHTMSGPSDGATKGYGINYLALNDLFKISNKRKDIMNYEIRVQMVEIYNEQVRDLLVEDSSTTKLEIRSCNRENNGLNLPDATIHPVKSTTDVLKLMNIGGMNRVVSSTAMNTCSSRSHSVLTVHVHGKDTAGSTLYSCLHLVDLAGSERVDKSEVTGDRLKEAQYINKSLSCLADVIMALAQKSSHIPYRNSKLTLLLQGSLGGQAKTLMFAHLSPEENSFSETVSTLKFSQRVSTVELGAARLNKESSEIIQLKEQVESLKKALASKEAQSTLINKAKEPRSPRQVNERTPPRPRRLSIENGSMLKAEKLTNGENINTPIYPTRSRRLSLEGPRHVKKDHLQIKGSEDTKKNLDFQALPVPSPTSNSYQKPVTYSETRTQIPSLHLPKSPERVKLARDDFQTRMQIKLPFPTDPSVTPNLIHISNGKGSQIRRSLRTIGKLINGSEKRNQPNLMEISTPVKDMCNMNDVKSPLTESTVTNRRQSLTGIPTSNRSRRTSLGGKPVESNGKDSRNAKTPPPVHPSTKSTKRWL